MSLKSLVLPKNQYTLLYSYKNLDQGWYVAHPMHPHIISRSRPFYWGGGGSGHICIVNLLIEGIHTVKDVQMDRGSLLAL